MNTIITGTEDKEALYESRIWTPDWQAEDSLVPRIVCFRKVISSDSVPENGILKISADSRYKLYINGRFIQEGPCKANKGSWYYEECRLKPYIRAGENCIAVEVLRYPEDFGRRNHSLLRTGLPFLYVLGEVCLDGVMKVFLKGASGWKCMQNKNIIFQGEDTVPAPLHIIENTTGNLLMTGWKQAGFVDTDWMAASEYEFNRMKLSDSPREMKKSPIPHQRHVKRLFRNVLAIRCWETKAGGHAGKQMVYRNMEELLSGKSPLTIPAGFHLIVDLDAGELMTGYPVMEILGGKGSDIRVLYTESYVYPDGRGGYIKGDRSCWQHGELHGSEDQYHVEGYGTKIMPEIYEPFWFRTFRYVRLDVVAHTQLQIGSFAYMETGYPLNAVTEVETSDASLKPVWDISLRTLRRCMHETYIDCPYYEQLQYAMDSRLEILYTYMVSGDDRLARKCMEDFRCSVHADGMINSCSPALREHVIPGFSIYYIMMVYDHMMYFGDRGLVKTHLPAIDSILYFFDARLDDRKLAGKTGGVNQRQNYWSFIDWTEEWQGTTGVPTAIRKGPVTMESLLYILGLQCAAALSEFAGRRDTGAEYLARAETVKLAVKSCCTGEDGLLQDGPGVPEYSVHCQVFGVLSGVLSMEDGKRLLEKTVGNKAYSQCSVAMTYYLFRALEKVGLYEKTDKLWDTWRDMVSKNMTTCVENNTDERSDCHAWASVILYELPAVVLGVRPAEPGFQSIRIHPVPGAFTSARGTVITPGGMVRVQWKKENGKLSLSYSVPEGVTVKEE